MKVLKKGYKEYKRYYAIPHAADETQLVRNTLYLHLPLSSHGQEGEEALLLNTMSGELLLLSGQEEEWWQQTEDGINIEDIDDEAQRTFLRQLAGHDFLVAATVNVPQVYEHGRDLARVTIDRLHGLTEGLDSYVILPTTDCNARCFYCYQKGRNMATMTPETAMEVAQLIERNYRINRQAVSIGWFGGEPLYNIQAIDLICDYLNEHEVKFSTRMISNSYLFTPDVQERAVSNWHLEHVQITLDGQEERYNKTKAFIYPETSPRKGEDRISPYQRVISNLLSADEKGIHIDVRVNVDLHNADELTALADELKERIGDRKTNISVYSNPLFETSVHIKGEHRDARIALAQFRMMRYLADLNLQKPSETSFEPKASWCMSDDPHAVVIQPDGALGKCEHYTDTKHYTDIRGSFFDEAQYNEYFEIYDRDPSCLECPLLARCYRLKVCQEEPACKPYELKAQIMEHKVAMMVAYKNYREKGKTLEEAPMALSDGMKIRDMEALQASAPADIWAASHCQYAATLPEGTWAMNFVYKFDIGNHPIQGIDVLRLDHTSATKKLLGSSQPLRQSLSAIAQAYFNEHPDDILVMKQKPAQQRLTARWYAEYNAQHPDRVAMLQGEATNKDGELIQLSFFIDHRCENFALVCEALSEQYAAFV